MNDSEENEVEQVEAWGWVEFGCWTALALTPFLYWVNGPAVSQDQLAIRWIVVLVAVVGGAGIRLHARRRHG